MIESVSDYSDGFLRATSRRSYSPAAVSLGACDVLMLSPSQQERSRKIIESGSVATELSIVISGGEPRGGIDVPAGIRCLPLSNVGRADPNVLAKIRLAITELVNKLERPLDVGIDLTCCPIYYCLALVAFLTNHGFSRRLSLFYAEGEYPEDAGQQDCHELFTAGDWEAVAIPGFQNPWTPKRSRLYLVSVGFEGYKTLRLCERREPDRVVVLFPDPGVRPDYVPRTQEMNQLLFDRFSIKEEKVIRANAADPVAAWQALTIKDSEDFENNAVEYLCCGTKPHSLAIALRALCTKQGVVSDIVAEEHLSPNVVPSGNYWRYDLLDLSAI